RERGVQGRVDRHVAGFGTGRDDPRMPGAAGVDPRVALRAVDHRDGAVIVVSDVDRAAGLVDGETEWAAADGDRMGGLGAAAPGPGVAGGGVEHRYRVAVAVLASVRGVESACGVVDVEPVRAAGVLERPWSAAACPPDRRVATGGVDNGDGVATEVRDV